MWSVRKIDLGADGTDSNLRALSPRHIIFPLLLRPSAMDAKPQRPKHQDAVLSSLNTAIDAINIAKDVMDIAPAKAVFGSVSVVLTMIRVGYP